MSNKNIAIAILAIVIIIGGVAYWLSFGSSSPTPAAPGSTPTSTGTQPTQPAGSSTGATPTPTPSQPAASKPKVTQPSVKAPMSLTIDILEKNRSNMTGQATFAQVAGGKTKVNIAINGAHAGEVLPASINFGRCATLGKVKYQLSNLVNGASDTLLPVSLGTILGGLPLAVNVNSSSTSGINVACGDMHY